MSLFDNRTHFQDCEDATHIAGQSTMGVTTDSNLSGTVLEGTNALGFQCDDAQEYFLYDLDSGGSTISLDMSDMTIYMNVKHNLGETFANLGGQIALCDEADAGGGDVIGYNVNGSDVSGFPYQFRYAAIKLDVSVIVAAPGTDDVDYYTYSGTEAGLDHTSINQIGYGELNIVKAVSSALNAWMDGIYYIANDSYAVSIEGGTSGTPETMDDVITDDEAVGMGLFNNPKGTEYGFFGPTEWGDGASGDTYFTSTNEQWYWIGDNQGGHTVGDNHFPFRLIGESGSTNSWVLVGTVIVNTGVLAQFDMSNADMDTATMDGCSLIGLGAIELPSATTNTTLNCIFSGCGIVTSNGGDMTGSSILTPVISANTSGLVWNLNQDPDGELDDMIFTKTSGVAHHAIEFGTAIPDAASYTLNGCEFGTDFSATEDGSTGDETFHFLDTTGSITLNLVGCTGNAGYRTEGVAVDIVVNPVATKVTVETPEGDFIENARVFLETADDGGTGLPYQDAVTTLVQAAGTATLTSTAVHGLATNDYVVVRGANEQDYNKTVQINVSSTTVFTYSVDSGAGTPAGGTPVFSYMALSGLTDSNGEITASKTWPASQSLSGWVRKSTGAPLFKETILSIADASGGTDLLVALQSDE